MALINSPSSSTAQNKSKFIILQLIYTAMNFSILCNSEDYLQASQDSLEMY